MKKGKSGFAELFKDPGFKSRLMALIFDEAHCISQWGSFRPEFREMGRLRHILQGRVPFHITSATLPEHVLSDVLNTMSIPRDNLYLMHRSNDRPNVFIAVREIKHAMDSFADLDFLVDDWASGKARPRKFIVFFNNIADSVAAGLRLRSRLPRRLRNQVKWHNSNMSSKFREDELNAFLAGRITGLLATDTIGMVSYNGVFITNLFHKLITIKKGGRLNRCRSGCTVSGTKPHHAYARTTSWPCWTRPRQRGIIPFLCGTQVFLEESKNGLGEGHWQETHIPG